MMMKSGMLFCAAVKLPPNLCLLFYQKSFLRCDLVLTLYLVRVNSNSKRINLIANLMVQDLNR